MGIIPNSKKKKLRRNTETLTGNVADTLEDLSNADTAFKTYAAIKEQEQKRQSELEAALDAVSEDCPFDGPPIQKYVNPLNRERALQEKAAQKQAAGRQHTNVNAPTEIRKAISKSPVKADSVSERWAAPSSDESFHIPARGSGSCGGDYSYQGSGSGRGYGLSSSAPSSLCYGDSIGGYASPRAKGYSQPKYRGTAPVVEPSEKVIMEGNADSLPELADKEAKLPQDVEMFDNVRGGLRIIRTSDTTNIYAYVVDKKGEDNKFGGVPCRGGVAYGGYAYDRSQDACLVECVQAVDLGSLPFAFKLQMPKCGTWCVECPIPEKVLEKSFTPPQRKKLAELRDRFPAERYDIHYIQMLNSN